LVALSSIQLHDCLLSGSYHVAYHVSTTLQDIDRPTWAWKNLNHDLLQSFEWNVPAGGKHCNRLHDALPAYKHVGIKYLAASRLQS
jgi:hypothetical protein